MDELKAGNLLLAALFGLPGFIFIQILAKFCFSTSRSYGGRTFQVLASFILSTIIIYVFDSDFAQPIVASAFHTVASLGFKISDAYIKFISETQLNRGLFEYVFLNKKPPDLSYLVATLVFVVTLFAMICSLLLVVVIKFLEWYSKTDLMDFVVATYHFASCFFIKLYRSCGGQPGYLTSSKRKRLRHSEAKTVSTDKLSKENWYYFIPLKILEGVLIVVFIIIVLAALLIVLGIVLVQSLFNLLSETILWVFHRLLDMFRHPCEQIFQPYRFSARIGVPIVEILSSENRINKGRLVGYQPKNSEELLSVTITSVIQYNKSIETPFFERTDRQVYEFPNRNSRLTITSDVIKDINVTYMKFSDFDWQFKILDETSIRNQLWYLKIMLERHKARFGFDKFSAWIDSKYAPLFFLELLQLLENSYALFFYKYKLQKLVWQLRKYLAPYRLDLKKNFANLTPEEQQEVNKAKSALAAALWKVRKKIK